MTEQELLNVYNDTAPIREGTEIECSFETFKRAYEGYEGDKNRANEVEIVKYIHGLLYWMKEHFRKH